MAFIKEGTH